MVRNASFLNLGKVLLFLGAIVHVGCVFPIAQAWCDFVLCPPSMWMSHGDSTPMTDRSEATSKTAMSDGTLCLHGPITTESMLTSHVSTDLVPYAEEPMTAIQVSRLELKTIFLNFDSPGLTISSPPPKSSLIS